MGYTVFNVEQIDGLPDLYYAKAESKLTPVERIERAEHFFAHTRAVIRYGGNRAYYAASEDRIQMPPLEAFRDAESFYATLAHESTHWTKHESRPQRDFGRKIPDCPSIAPTRGLRSAHRNADPSSATSSSRA